MKKIVVCLLIITLLCALPLTFCGCAHKGAEIYRPRKYKETIDLSKYDLVFFDDFDGELERNVWCDTRQGTRRDGFWVDDLAFTDGEGHLVIRTEKRGSRFCSDTHERQVVGYDQSRVTLQYDDCYPFGLVANDFGDLSAVEAHTQENAGLVILDYFDLLGERFLSFAEADAQSDKDQLYALYFETAAKLFSYYSFVPEVKAVQSDLAKSALVGINRDLFATFDPLTESQNLPLRSVLAHLFGFSAESEFVTCAQSLADVYQAQRQNGNACAALENGAFLTDDGVLIAPIAFRNESTITLSYVIATPDGGVFVWINDLSSALRSTNHDADHYIAPTVKNETYCKNVLFVTGPEGVYSGAVRTLPIKDHDGNVKAAGYTHGFGYYEIRCKLPDVEGIWHAFWMMCGDVYSVENGSTDGVEIDVFEYLPALDAVNVALHWDGYDEAHKNAHKRFEKTGFADGEYHTFGMNWDESGYAFYIDGKKVWKSTGGGVCYENGYMKISTEYGEWGDWVGKLDLKDLPVDWVIDYVKIYDKKA